MGFKSSQIVDGYLHSIYVTIAPVYFASLLYVGRIVARWNGWLLFPSSIMDISNRGKASSYIQAWFLLLDDVRNLYLQQLCLTIRLWRVTNSLGNSLSCFIGEGKSMAPLANDLKDVTLSWLWRFYLVVCLLGLFSPIICWLYLNCFHICILGSSTVVSFHMTFQKTFSIVSLHIPSFTLPFLRLSSLLSI